MLMSRVTGYELSVGGGVSPGNRHLKQDDAFNRTWWSVLSILSLLLGNTYQLKELAATSC